MEPNEQSVQAVPTPAVVVAPVVIAPVAKKPDFHLVVVHPFGDYRRGDPITSASEIKAVMSGENKHHVHKVAAQ